MIMPEPTKIKLELMSNEVELIKDELERASHLVYTTFNYDKIVKKLNKALEEAYKK